MFFEFTHVSTNSILNPLPPIIRSLLGFSLPRICAVFSSYLLLASFIQIRSTMQASHTNFSTSVLYTKKST